MPTAEQNAQEMFPLLADLLDRSSAELHRAPTMTFFTASNQRILCTAFGVEVPGGSARLNQMTLMNIYSKIEGRLRGRDLDEIADPDHDALVDNLKTLADADPVAEGEGERNDNDEGQQEQEDGEGEDGGLGGRSDGDIVDLRTIFMDANGVPLDGEAMIKAGAAIWTALAPGWNVPRQHNPSQQRLQCKRMNETIKEADVPWKKLRASIDPNNPGEYDVNVDHELFDNFDNLRGPLSAAVQRLYVDPDTDKGPTGTSLAMGSSHPKAEQAIRDGEAIETFRARKMAANPDIISQAEEINGATGADQFRKTAVSSGTNHELRKVVASKQVTAIQAEGDTNCELFRNIGQTWDTITTETFMHVFGEHACKDGWRKELRCIKMLDTKFLLDKFRTMMPSIPDDFGWMELNKCFDNLAKLLDMLCGDERRANGAWDSLTGMATEIRDLGGTIDQYVDKIFTPIMTIWLGRVHLWYKDMVDTGDCPLLSDVLDWDNERHRNLRDQGAVTAQKLRKAWKTLTNELQMAEQVRAQMTASGFTAGGGGNGGNGGGGGRNGGGGGGGGGAGGGKPKDKCRDHANGNCLRGNNCRFVHDDKPVASVGNKPWLLGGHVVNQPFMDEYESAAITLGDTKEQARARCKWEDFHGKACTIANCKAGRHPISKNEGSTFDRGKVTAAMAKHGVRPSTADERKQGRKRRG
jgi:hypothetical protein